MTHGRAPIQVRSRPIRYLPLLAVRWWRRILELSSACVWLAVVCLEGLPALAQSRGGQAGSPGPRSGGVVITNFATLRGMTPAAAAAHPPVRLGGVITYYDEAQEVGFLQEGDAGVAFVPGASPGSPAPKPGDRAELIGVTDPGEFTPMVNGGAGGARALVRVLGRSSLPTGPIPAVDELQEGRLDSRVVRVRGVVRRVTTAQLGRVQAPLMVLQWGTVQLEVFFPQSVERARLTAQIDSRLEVTAVCWGNSNNNRQLIEVRLYCPGPDAVRVLETAPAASQLPVRALGSLLRFDSPRSGGHRVRVAGTVLGPGPYRSYFLWDGTNGVRFEPSEPLTLTPGDRVDCLGFPAPGPYNPALQDAIVQVVGAGPLPAPELRESIQDIGESSEGHRIFVTGALQQQAFGPEGHTLTLRLRDGVYFATLPGPRPDAVLAAIPIGSEVLAVGVPSTVQDPQRHPMNSRLWLARPKDVRVVRSAPWWTPSRVRVGALVLAVVLAVVLGFGAQLARRTRALEAEVRERKRVEEELRSVRKGLEDTVAQREFRLFSISEEREQIARELRHRESLVQEVIEALPDIVVVRDATGRIVLSNAAAAQFLGIQSSRKPNAQDLSGVPIASPELTDTDRAVLLSGKENAGPPEPWQGRDGALRWFEVTRRRITRPDGTRFLLGVATEVTARKQAEEDQRSALESADAATRAKGDFLARMSHEIRTPMNGVIGMVNLILGTKLAPEQRDFAETALRSAEGLLAIINDILDFSKIEAGKLTMESVEFDLRIMLEESLDLLAERAQSKGVELMLSMPRTVPGWVTGDPGRLRQVVLNLVGNAVKFTNRGTVVVDVTCQESPGSDPVFRISVEDTGCGIPADLLQRLFQPFEQGEQSGTRKSGTGLGLVISKHLIELMHGEIGVQSEPQTGTRFWFSIPMRPTRTDHVSGLPDPRLAGVRVAILAGGTRFQQVLSELVQTVGAVVSGVYVDGTAAMAALRAQSMAELGPRVVLLDEPAGSPGMSDWIRMVRSDPALAQIRTIQLLPLAHSAAGSAMVSRAGDGFVFKPVKAALLADRIATVLAAPISVPAAPAVKDPSPARSSLKSHPDLPMDLGFQPPPVRERHAAPAAAGRAGDRKPAGDSEGRIDEVEAIPEGLARLPVFLRILIAEDNPTNQKLAVYVLKKLGCETTVVGNGAEALTALETGTFDILLMDCQMPELDGFEATRRIRRSAAPWASIPIVAVTAAAMIGDRDRCMAAGMNDYLTKPLRPHDLRAALLRNLPEALRETLKGQASDDHLDRSAREELIADDAEGGKALYLELVDIFLTSVPKLMADIQLGAADGNLEKIRAAAHTLKGSCAAMGAKKLGSLTRLLEVAAHHGETEQALRLVTDVNREFEAVAELLRAETRAAGGGPERPV